MATCEIWIVVDENGDYAVGKDRERAEDYYRDDICAEAGSCMRVIRLTADVPEPKPIELSCKVPEEDCPAVELSLAAAV